MSVRACAVADCGRVRFCKGFCRVHYERWKRHGDPSVCLKRMSARGQPRKWIEDHARHEGAACLIWPFARFPDGRAHLNGGKPARIMCELAHGVAPSPGHQAAHACGRGADGCVNPQHLRWATPVENAADKEDHGTVVRGGDHHAAKLDQVDILEIRRLHRSMPQREIADIFGVGLSCVNKIVNRKSWRHVA